MTQSKNITDGLNFVSWKEPERYKIYKDRSNMFSFHLRRKVRRPLRGNVRIEQILSIRTMRQEKQLLRM